MRFLNCAKGSNLRQQPSINEWAYVASLKLNVFKLKIIEENADIINRI